MLSLDKLDTIDWPTLKTAYGTADALPMALRNLAAPDEEVRVAAWYTVRSELEHQGTVYQASAYVAPVLVGWLPELPYEEKRDMVTFLARLARGNGYKRQHLNLTDKQLKQDPIFQQETAEEIRWVELTHQAVRQGRDLYLACLDDQDLELRMATTYLLASFKEDQVRLIPHLRLYLERETDEHMVSCLPLSLGQLLPATEDSSALLMPYLTANSTPLVRFCAAMALFFLAKETIPEEVVDVFFGAFTNPASLQAVYDELPTTWAGRAVDFHAFEFLYWLTSSRHGARIIRQLAELLPTLDEVLALDVADRLLYAAFHWDELSPPPEVAREDLNAEHRVVLHAIASSNLLWVAEQEPPDQEIWSGIRQDLLFLDLPARQQDLRAFLALDKPSDCTG